MWQADGRQIQVRLIRACAIHGGRCKSRITSIHLMQRVSVCITIHEQADGNEHRG